MDATERAAQKLKDDLIREFLDKGIGFRLVGDGAGDSHKDLTMKLDRASPADIVVQRCGVKILLDPASAAVLERYELDYKDDSGGFFLSPRD